MRDVACVTNSYDTWLKPTLTGDSGAIGR